MKYVTTQQAAHNCEATLLYGRQTLPYIRCPGTSYLDSSGGADLGFQVSNALIQRSLLRQRLLKRRQLCMQVALLGRQGLRCAVSLLQLPLAVLQALLPNVHLSRALHSQVKWSALPWIPCLPWMAP